MFKMQPKEVNPAVTNSGLNAFLTKMYGYMSMAILVSALVAYYFGSVIHYKMSGAVMLISLVVWFILPFVLGKQAIKNYMVGTVLLAVYAGLTGFVFSDIFEMYAGSTIASAFVSSAGIFAGMSFIGKVTHKNLAKLGTQLFGALIGLIVAMVINIFLQNSMIELFLSIASVIIFSLLTMFDVKQMKDMYFHLAGQMNLNGIAINGALTLYLDFINIFISLLEIFAGNGNNR